MVSSVCAVLCKWLVLAIEVAKFAKFESKIVAADKSIKSAQLNIHILQRILSGGFADRKTVVPKQTVAPKIKEETKKTTKKKVQPSKIVTGKKK